MNRLSISDVELRYPSQSDRVPYFSIKNDRESKQVRFLYNTINDIYFDIVHEVDNGSGRTQTVSCLNSDGSNNDSCPCCKAGFNQIIRLYIPVLDLSDNTVKIWTRSKGFISQLQALAARNNPISGTVVEITRAGAPRDPKTQYILQPITANDGKTVDMLGVSVPDITKVVRSMNFNEMTSFINASNHNAAQLNQVVSRPPMQSSGNYTPIQTQTITSEPVRIGPGAPSIPNYGAPTTPMAGVPSNNQNYYASPVDDNLPF